MWSERGLQWEQSRVRVQRWRAVLIWARVKCVVWIEIRLDLLCDSSRRADMAWGQWQSVWMLVWVELSNSKVGNARSLSDADVGWVLTLSFSSCH